MTTTGHIAGNLNFVATRNGWARNATLTPEQVSKLDYAAIETMLELHTLKSRNLRIFLEHPAGSDNFLKLRPWKDDGSFQTVITKAFFEERMSSGVVTTIDIRDAKPLVDPSVPPIPNMGEKAREWLKARAAQVTTPGEASNDNGEKDLPDMPAGQNGGFFGLFRQNGSATATDTAPPDGDAQPEGEKKEEDILRERGWQPMLRRLTSKRRKGKKSTEPKEDADIQAEGSGEELAIPDGEETNKKPEKNPFLGLSSRSRIFGQKKDKDSNKNEKGTSDEESAKSADKKAVPATS